MADYTTLITEILNTTENDAVEFINQLPNIVNRAEERMVDDLDDYGLVSYTILMSLQMAREQIY